MQFHNRTYELSEIGRLLQLSQKRRQFVYVSGRRRIGKTALLNEAFKGKNPFYFFVGRDTEKEFLTRFSSAVSLCNEFGPNVRFDSIDDAVAFIFNQLLLKKDAVILDEFQNFSHISNAAFSRFQMHWDSTKESGSGLLVACGSMQSLMHTIFTGLKEPLYKRATARLQVEEFSPLAVAELIEKMTGHRHSSQFFEWYSIFGGIPFYYDLIDRLGLVKKTTEEILSALVFDKNSVLYDEGKDLTIEAMGKSYPVFFSILSAVASGKTKYNEILDKTGIAPGSMDKYVGQLLEDYRYLLREQSIGSKKAHSRISRYSFSDNFLSFWFRFVYPYQSMLESNGIKALLSIVRKELSTWQGPKWEKTVTAILLELNLSQKFEFHFTDIGRYFNQNLDGDIDIVMQNQEADTFAVGECKLNLNTVNLPDTISTLEERAGQLRKSISKRYIFSMAPITKKTRLILDKYKHVAAFDLDDLLSASRKS